MKKENWIWMPHPAHYILRYKCQFRLATYVGGYIVSTIGACEEVPGSGPIIEIGLDRKYETMVFTAIKTVRKCCPYGIDEEVECVPYNDADSATKGHHKLCRKWSKKK